MDGYTQFGVAGVMLGIFFFIIRYFVSAMKESRRDNKDLTDKFIKMNEDNIKTNTNLTRSIEANTQITQKSTDMLTALTLKIIKDA